MNKIKIHHNVNEIEGLCIIEPQLSYKQCGYCFETYNVDLFKENELGAIFVQDNEVFSKKGTLRGFGINIKCPQAKLIRVLNGAIFDVVIDLRPASKTFMRYYSICLTAVNRKQLYIPEGFAHAYLATEDARVLFKVTTHYIKGEELTFAWNSSAFNIKWPINEEELILSDTDRTSLEFDKAMVLK